MNGLDEIRVAREGLEGSCLIPPEERGDVVLLHLQSGKVEPRQGILEVAPDPFNGVELWTIRRQEHEGHVVRQGEPLGGMRSTVIQQQDIQAVSEGLGEGIDEELEHVRIEIRQFQKEVLASGRCHGTVHIAPLKDVLNRANRLHPASGEAPPADSQEAEAAFVLTEHADGAGVRSRNGPPEVGLTGGLERYNGLRLFLCDWGAAL